MITTGPVCGIENYSLFFKQLQGIFGRDFHHLLLPLIGE
jgi:hypothetical protein